MRAAPAIEGSGGLVAENLLVAKLALTRGRRLAWATVDDLAVRLDRSPGAVAHLAREVEEAALAAYCAVRGVALTEGGRRFARREARYRWWVAWSEIMELESTSGSCRK